MKLGVFRRKLSQHVDMYAEGTTVLTRYQNTLWDIEFYGWVFKVYKMGVRRTRGILKVFVE